MTLKTTNTVQVCVCVFGMVGGRQFFFLCIREMLLSSAVLQSKPSSLGGKYVQCSEAQALLLISDCSCFVKPCVNTLDITTNVFSYGTTGQYYICTFYYACIFHSSTIFTLTTTLNSFFLVTAGLWDWSFRARTSILTVIQTTSWTPGHTWRVPCPIRAAPSPGSSREMT